MLFVQQYITEDWTDKKNENKKEKAKNYFLANKEKLQKNIESVVEIILKKRIKKSNYANTRNKNLSNSDRKRK